MTYNVFSGTFNSALSICHSREHCGPKETLLDGGADSPMGRGNFEGGKGGLL